ncbi:MAG: protein kinase domain-containing protein [Isosphaeraceae bacterium]
MADVNAGRNFLFGLLALQNGLINHDQLVAAVWAWSCDQGCQIADYLVDRGVLDASQRSVVQAMVAQHEKKHGDSTEQSSAAITAGRSTSESLAALGDTEIGETLTQAGAGPASTQIDSGLDHSGAYSVGSITSDGQRFRVLRPHARGGLGAVFVALDTELHREVALKTILDRHADDPASRARFMLEAEVTGGLEHPGIVPVYGLGIYGSGRPYYAMRFIKGDSLKEVIEHFHGDPGRVSAASPAEPARVSAGSPAEPGRVSAASPGEPGRVSAGSRSKKQGRGANGSPLAFRQLLRRFLDVCDAIDYAHSRGVLHRDIKPGNIIIGKHGETLVVDWGLAKAQGRPDAGPSDERPLVPSSASGPSDTLPGRVLGTPSYMSPEQARGDLEQLGPRSDVYSLGATLYCLLTGKPPFEGGVIEVIEAVQRGAFQPPRFLAPSIDRALEAVCRKAMALDPADRYATPKALAEDVERWMADEPVAAYRESWARALTRWLTRHRTGVTALGAAMLVALAGLAAVLGVQARANGQLTVKNTELDAAFRREAQIRKEAETNFNMARNAVDNYLTSVSENTLLKQQDSVDIRSLRRELLSTALKYYKSFVNQRNNDPNLRRQLANAYFRVGEITQEIDSRIEAIEAFQSAQSVWEALTAADPENHELHGRLADCHLAIGKQKDALGDLQGAMTSFDRARSVLEPLAALQLDPALYQPLLADCYAEIGIIQGKLQSGDQGLESLEKARAIQQGLIARYPREIRYRQRLAEIINVQGFVYSKRLEYAAAIRCFEEVQKICQSLLDQVTAGPKPVKLLDLLALSHYNIATIHYANGRFEQALESLEKSLKYRSELAALHPSVTRFRENLGETHEVIADIQHKLHRDDQAFSSLQMAIDILEKLVQTHPDQARHHAWLGRSFNALGCLHDELRHNQQAIPAFEKAVQEEERAIARSPDDNEYKVLYCVQLENLGEQYVDLGQVDRGLPYYRHAIQIRRQLFSSHRKTRAYLLDLAQALSTLGDIQRHAGDSTAARDSSFEARSLLERAAAAMPGDPELQVRLGAALVGEAGAVSDLRDPEQARSLLDRAVKSLSGASVSSTGKALRSEWQSQALWELARVLRALNNRVEADKVDAQRVALWQDRPPRELAALALKETSLGALIGYGKTPVPPAALSVRELDLDQAAADLELAIARGFRDLRMLKSHPDSEMLLSREDLKLPIMDIAFPDRPFGSH